MTKFDDEFEKLNDVEKKDISELMEHLSYNINCTIDLKFCIPKRIVDEIFETMSENVCECWTNYLDSVAKSIQAD